MVVKGSGGEKYSLDSKRKKTYRTYTDYAVGNSGMYVARIFDRSHRNHSVEQDVEDAIRNADYYEDERPLNALYMGKKFAGFLYEGDGSLNEIAEENYDDDETSNVPARTGNAVRLGDGADAIIIVAVQVIVAIVMAVIGKMAIYPILGRYMTNSVESSIINILQLLDYEGIPAIICGIVFQAIVFMKFKDRMQNIIVSGLVAMLANLVGTVLWTFLVLLIMVIVQGAISFIMQYLVYIILIVIAILWLKKKFRF